MHTRVRAAVWRGSAAKAGRCILRRYLDALFTHFDLKRKDVTGTTTPLHPDSSLPPDLWPRCLLEECCRSVKECSSSRRRRKRTCWDEGIQTISHSLAHTHTNAHKPGTFIELIFVAAMAFNWSQSGPLPRAGADERAPFSTTLSTDFPGLPNKDPGRGQRKAITDATIENFQFLTGFRPRFCLPVTNALVCWELLTPYFPFSSFDVTWRKPSSPFL